MCLLVVGCSECCALVGVCCVHTRFAPDFEFIMFISFESKLCFSLVVSGYIISSQTICVWFAIANTNAQRVAAGGGEVFYNLVLMVCV